MEKYNVVAWVAVEVDADGNDDAIEKVSSQIRDMKPSDFEYEVVKAE